VRRNAWMPLVLALALAPAACSNADGTGGDAQPQGDAGRDVPVATDVADAVEVASGRDFVCNQVMGVSVTGDWFTAGFETAVEDGRWQVVSKTHAYIDLWSDPANAVWSTPVVSPCTQDSDDPDRVLFTGCNWEYTTVEEWTAAFEAVLVALKGKYPGLKRVDLLTMLRAPGNQVCIADLTEVVVQPFIDEAIANVVAAHPGFVTAAPKFYAPNCDVFSFGGPHFAEGGAEEVAQVFGAYYSAEP
jgi:hypothetical protein